MLDQTSCACAGGTADCAIARGPLAPSPNQRRHAGVAAIAADSAAAPDGTVDSGRSTPVTVALG